MPQVSIENEVAPERGERVDDLWEATAQRFPNARKQRDLPSALQGNAAIAVEFDLKGPLFIRWKRGDRLALHRLNERRFCPSDLRGASSSSRKLQAGCFPIARRYLRSRSK
jgi:hypothetical protein